MSHGFVVAKKAGFSGHSCCRKGPRPSQGAAFMMRQAKTMAVIARKQNAATAVFSSFGFMGGSQVVQNASGEVLEIIGQADRSFGE